jgi:hypothetical protein
VPLLQDRQVSHARTQDLVQAAAADFTAAQALADHHLMETRLNRQNWIAIGQDFWLVWFISLMVARAQDF